MDNGLRVRSGNMIWTSLIGAAGVGLGIFSGHWAAEATWDCTVKRNCIVSYSVSECEGCETEEDEKQCGNVISAVGLAFEVLDGGAHDGYDDSTYWSAQQDGCYVKYECVITQFVTAGCVAPEEYRCLPDDEPSTINWAYDNGIFSDPCD